PVRPGYCNVLCRSGGWVQGRAESCTRRLPRKSRAGSCSEDGRDPERDGGGVRCGFISDGERDPEGAARTGFHLCAFVSPNRPTRPGQPRLTLTVRQRSAGAVGWPG